MLNSSPQSVPESHVQIAEPAAQGYAPAAAHADDSASATEELAYIGKTADALRESFNSGKTRDLGWRDAQLQGLLNMIEENSEEFIDAICADVGKPRFEAWIAEIHGLTSRIKTYRQKLRKWTSPEKVPSLNAAKPAKSTVVREPLGVVLVLSPWNYPLELCLAPLIGALAAGNCVLLKPSEVAPRTARLIAQLVPKYVDSDCVKVIEGAVPETTELLRQHFDHIFYTGNGKVGRVVMRAAAEHLTPITLELGGKCPCIVDNTAKLRVAARRIVWGKFLNSGQTCVAPDYLLVHEDVYDDFLEELKATIKSFYGEDPSQSSDFGRIVNERHHRRIMRLLEGGGQVYCGGEAKEAERYIAPTVLTDIPADAAILQEEIFGPLLPVIKVKDTSDAIDYVNRRAKPLALYLFSESKAARDAVLSRTSSGGMAVNAILLHILGSDLPFGGVGESGLGKYHGKYSIDTFSNLRAVLDKATWIDPDLAYPPATESKKKWLRRLA